jgi:hypothetical protein
MSKDDQAEMAYHINKRLGQEISTKILEVQRKIDPRDIPYLEIRYKAEDPLVHYVVLRGQSLMRLEIKIVCTP